jgi:hypothetical protein
MWSSLLLLQIVCCIVWQCFGAGEELSAAIDDGHIRDTDESKVGFGCSSFAWFLSSSSVLRCSLLR